MLLLRGNCAAQGRQFPQKLWCHCGNNGTRQGLQMLTWAGVAEMLAEAAMLIGTWSPAAAAPLLSPAIPCA